MSFTTPVYLPGGKALIVGGKFNKRADVCCCGPVPGDCNALDWTLSDTGFTVTVTGIVGYNPPDSVRGMSKMYPPDKTYVNASGDTLSTLVCTAGYLVLTIHEDGFVAGGNLVFKAAFGGLTAVTLAGISGLAWVLDSKTLAWDFVDTSAAAVVFS